VEATDEPLWRLALAQFRSLVVVLLAVGAAIALALGESMEGLAILAALILNAGIGFVTEWRARRSLARLRALVVPRARVRRHGRATTVSASDLVPGDVVIVEAGAQVPAERSTELARWRHGAHGDGRTDSRTASQHRDRRGAGRRLGDGRRRAG
jgi:Ca2+-transporting ATPase